MCQKSNSRSVREKTTGNLLECTGNTLASWPLNQQRYDLLSQKQESSTAYSTRISKVQVLNDQALFLCWPRMHYCLMTAFVIQPISCRKNRDSCFLNNNSRRRVLNVEIYFPQKMSFEDFFQAKIFLWSGVEPVYSLLNLIHFHMNALTYPWEIVKISIIIIW